MPGTLYLVATPIGNLEDITARALRILSEVDVVAAEDTRLSGRLLHHFAIKKPLISYYEQNKGLREEQLLRRLQDGESVALVSDAGTPGVSDPGADLAAAAIAAGIEVFSIPGASAVLTALPVSGLPAGPFCFEGFLPRRKKDRQQRLRELADDTRPVVFYEAPHRLRAMLVDLADIFGNERQMAACRELTKLHEEKLRGTVAEIRAHFDAIEPRGEFTLVVDGVAPPTADAVAEDDLAAELDALLAQGLPRKQAARQLAQLHGLKVNEVYRLGLTP